MALNCYGPCHYQLKLMFSELHFAQSMGILISRTPILREEGIQHNCAPAQPKQREHILNSGVKIRIAHE
jgi:hypothetical protein